MAGNSQRRGAKRNPGSKKGAVVGSGGKRARGLTGRGPTPAASERPQHPAARRAKSAAKRNDSASTTSAAYGSRGAGLRGGRVSDGPETVAGRNSVVEALRASVPVTALLVAERIDADDRVREAVQLARDNGLPLLEAPRAELDRITKGSVHQGLVLQVPAYEYAHPDDLLAAAHRAGEPPLLAALDGVTDPRNLGAVVRSMAAFGGHGVLVPERRSAGMTVGAWKSSAGAAARVPVARATNLVRALAAYQDAGCMIVGLAADGAVDLDDIPVTDDPVVLVVGSEGKGLSRLVSAGCDLLVRIPMRSETESLNAAVAASIVLAELDRRRRTR